MDSQIKVLILGAGGFVGTAFRQALQRNFGSRATVLATSRRPSGDTKPLDIGDTEGVLDMIGAFEPTHIVNLAGIASPMVARQNPDLAREIHALAPQRMARRLATMHPDCWLLHISTGMVYGRSALSGDPINEDANLDPLDVYGASKAEGDRALVAMAQEGLKAMVLRPFNHTGPSQTADYVIPAFAAQIAAIEAGMQQPVIHVGNLDTVRDFLHVDDVAQAYCGLIAQSGQITSGTVFNLASGHGLRIKNALDYFTERCRKPVTVVPDPARQRASDLPVIIGDASRLRARIGWAPRYGVSDMLDDVLTAQRARWA